jgi:hypothetical protein
MHGLDSLPPRWEQHTHPDGKPYFRHVDWNVVTEAYIRDAVVRGKIEMLYSRVEATRLFAKAGVGISDEEKRANRRELYLILDPKEAYYFVDHDIQSIFWLHDVPLKELGLSEKAPAMSFGKKKCTVLRSTSMIH